MKNIDLGPNDYKIRDPRTGRWHFTDDRKLARNYLVVLIAVLGFIYLHRDEFGADVLFGVAVLFAFCAGGLFAIWLKDRY